MPEVVIIMTIIGAYGILLHVGSPSLSDHSELEGAH